ncbi:MAG: DUF4350 domain-containing protein [Acidimicrobiales bacterium]
MSTVVSVRKPGAGERWKALPRLWQVVLVVVAASVAIVLGLGDISSLYSSPNNTAIGPASSLDSGGPGTAALADLLSQRHYHVRQLTAPITPSSLPVTGTLFVLDAATSLAGDLPAMRRYVADGGRLVLGGRLAPSVLGALVTGEPPSWQSTPASVAHPIGTAPETRGVAHVDTGSAGTWTVPHSSQVRVLMAGAGGAYALVAGSPAVSGSPSSGSLVLLASSAPLENSNLAKLDDAAFGLDLAGTPGTSVAFDEYVHGFGRPGNGLAGLPSHWKLALILAVVAAATWMLSASRRLGPPQPASVAAMPPRVAHVDALAELLASGPTTRALAGAAPLRERARQLLSRRLQAPSGCEDDALGALAAAAGDPLVDPRLVACLLNEPRSPEELVALSQALAEIERRTTTKGRDE